MKKRKQKRILQNIIRDPVKRAAYIKHLTWQKLSSAILDKKLGSYCIHIQDLKLVTYRDSKKHKKWKLELFCTGKTLPILSRFQSFTYEK